MDVYYETYAFRFEPSPGDPMAGRLLLDHEQRVLLSTLLEAEDESWALDNDGERLPTDQLFALSPWSAITQDGSTKILCRSINPQNGIVIFCTPESYPGDTSAWARVDAR